MPVPPDFAEQFAKIRELIACPHCKGELALSGDKLICLNHGCTFAIVDGIPVLTPQNPS